MINVDFVNSKNEYYDYCNKLFNTHQGPMHWLVKNKILEIPNIYHAVETEFNVGYEPLRPSYLDIFSYKDNKQFLGLIAKELDLTYCAVSLHIQQYGKTVPPHVDRNTVFLKSLPNHVLQTKNYTDIRRFIYAVEDQKCGHFFGIDTELVEWKKGDFIEFPFYVSHATANSSTIPRPLLLIVGI